MNRLKELRQEKKLSQKEIALELQTPLRTYQRWENEESQIKPDKVQQLADFFGVSVGYLLGYEDLLTQIEEVESELSKGMSASKKMASAASSNYDELLKNTLTLLSELKKVAEVTQVDSNTLIEVIEVLKEHIKDLDDCVKKMVDSQIKYVELLNLRKKLKQYKD
ncbi:helix-turn-helix domain-containing protein [Streptococcus gallolyticus]|uniref:helix-turn-helix domain-containing protein n=1 Tax=Streptococcus gallolyticus TaxID=315405 RepID=UPI003D6E3D4A